MLTVDEFLRDKTKKEGVGEEGRRAGVEEHRGLHGHSCRASRVKSEELE